MVEVGLDFQVGIGGSRLSTAQRQKLAVARAVLKRPDVFILSEATSALDGATQTKVVANLLEGVQWPRADLGAATAQPRQPVRTACW